MQQNVSLWYSNNGKITVINNNKNSMGLCHTEEDTNNIQRNIEIDRQLERDRGRREKEYKILLLGKQ